MTLKALVGEAVLVLFLIATMYVVPALFGNAGPTLPAVLLVVLAWIALRALMIRFVENRDRHAQPADRA